MFLDYFRFSNIDFSILVYTKLFKVRMRFSNFLLGIIFVLYEHCLLQSFHSKYLRCCNVDKTNNSTQVIAHIIAHK